MIMSLLFNVVKMMLNETWGKADLWSWSCAAISPAAWPSPPAVTPWQLSAEPSSQLHLRAKHRGGQGPHPPAWFTFPRGQTSPANQNLLLARVWSTLPSWDIPFSSTGADKREKNSNSSSSYTGLFYGLSGKHPTVLNLHCGKSNFD